MTFTIEVARAMPIAATTTTAVGEPIEITIAGELAAAHWADLSLISPPLQEVAAMGLGISRTSIHRTELLAGSRSHLTPMIRLEADVEDGNALRAGYGACAAFVSALARNPFGQHLSWELHAAIAHLDTEIQGVVNEFALCAGGKALKAPTVVRAPGRADLAIPMKIPRPADTAVATRQSDQLVGYFDGYCVSRRLLLVISEGGSQWKVCYDELKFLRQIVELGSRLSVTARALCQFDVDVEGEPGRAAFFLRAFEVQRIVPRVSPQDALSFDTVGDDSSVSEALEIE